LLEGIKKATGDSHFEQPIEVTELVRSNPIYMNPWMVCIRSAKSEESKRVTYSAFFNDKGFVFARYSAVMDPCASQAYHPLR
jgi:hypothetical protein